MESFHLRLVAAFGLSICSFAFITDFRLTEVCPSSVGVFPSTGVLFASSGSIVSADDSEALAVLESCSATIEVEVQVEDSDGRGRWAWVLPQLLQNCRKSLATTEKMSKLGV